MSISGSAKGLVKGIAIVDLVVDSAEPLRATDITAASGLPHSTCIRLLDVLTRLGLLHVDAYGLYELGPHAATWGWSFQRTFDLTRHAQDLIESLVEQTNETAFLGVLDRASVLYIAHAPTPQAVRPAARIGSRNPLHCTGIGKSLLAFLDADQREALLGDTLERRTENTITDRNQLDAELALIRERRYAIDDIENEEGVRCIAAPVLGKDGEAIAALSVSAPAYRFSLDDVAALAPRIVAVATELSARAGYRSQQERTSTQEGTHA